MFMKKKMLLFIAIIGLIVFIYPNNKVNASENNAPAEDIIETIVENAEENLPIFSMDQVNTMSEEELPENFLVKEDQNPKLRSASLGYQKWSKVSTTRLNTNVFITWHPSFKGYTKGTSGYYFSNSATVDVSVSFGYGAVSIGIAKGGSAGTFYAANKSKSTRPAIYGNKNKIKWSVKYYNGANIYQKTETKYTGSVTGQYIKILNK